MSTIHMTAPITNATFQAETYLIDDVIYKKSNINKTSGSVRMYVIDSDYHPCHDIMIRITINQMYDYSIDDLLNNVYFANINKIENVTSASYNSIYLKDTDYVIKGNVIDVFFDLTKTYLDERYYPLIQANTSTNVRNWTLERSCIIFDKANIKERILQLFQNLPVMTTAKTIYIGEYLSILTDEDKKIATDKGWTVAA